MNFQLETAVPALTVFLQGLLSFFSPCVLPLIPLYVGYLAGGAKVERPDGTVAYPRGKTALNTLFFVLGVSFAFFLLGFGFTALGQFFSGHQTAFARISGIIVVLFGLYQLGAFGTSKSLTKERRLPFSLQKLAMNPLTALVMGFTFSFAWTPCVGPTLTSVLLMAGSAGSAASGFGLIGVYTLGFAVPFLLVGMFTGAVLDFFKKHMAVVRYTVKIGGVIMVLMGVMLLTGWMNGFTSYLSRLSGTDAPRQETVETTPAPSVSVPDGEKDAAGSSEPSDGSAAAPADGSDTSAMPTAPDFTLVDQNGESHTLSDYQGKTVFLNFWATWCGPCRREMPDIQAMYEAYGKNEGELVVLGVANPKSDAYPKSSDGTVDEVTAFLEENGYDYPVAMDDSGDVFAQYGVTAFPTTFMINTEGEVFGYVTGTLTGDMMESIVRQTISGERTD